MPIPTHWRVISPQGLQIRRWDEEFVVYNPLSGNTHVLDGVTGALFASIASGNGAEDALLENASSLVEYPDLPSRLENVRFMLTVLFNLGLIEPCASC